MRYTYFLFAAISIAIGLLLFATGCNTMKGAGQDVEQTGRNIQETVNRI